MNIIYEDNHLLVVDKPSGLSTQPSPHANKSLEEEMKEYVRHQTGKKGNIYLHAIHRLDRPVSGIVVFAKTSKALERLNTSMREKKGKKIYHAIVEGVSLPSSGLWEDFLIHGNFQAHVVEKQVEGAKHACLSFTVLEERKSITKLEIELITGRYHQIRIQCASRGFPILGDQKYGSKQPYQEGAIALHHTRLEIEHPISHTLLAFQSEKKL